MLEGGCIQQDVMVELSWRVSEAGHPACAVARQISKGETEFAKRPQRGDGDVRSHMGELGKRPRQLALQIK